MSDATIEEAAQAIDGTFSAEEVAKSYTAEALAEQVDKLFMFDQQIKEYEVLIKELKLAQKEVDTHIKSILDVLELDAAVGSKGTYRIKEVVGGIKKPVGDDWDAFVEYLKSLPDGTGRTEWDNMATVNTQTLRSWYKRMKAQSEAEGAISFDIPGIEPPQTFYKGEWK